MSYSEVRRRSSQKNTRLQALIRNDLAVLDALAGKLEEARDGLRRAIEADGERLLARLNRDLIEAEIGLVDGERCSASGRARGIWPET